MKISTQVSQLSLFHGEVILLHIQGDCLCHTQRNNLVFLAESALAKRPFGFEV